MTLEQPTVGTIIVDGKNLWQMEKKGRLILANEKHLSQVRGDIGMVFQHFNLFPHMTILDNCMTAPIQVQKEDKTTAKKRSIDMRSEEHTSELQSRGHLVCRLLLEK